MSTLATAVGIEGHSRPVRTGRWWLTRFVLPIVSLVVLVGLQYGRIAAMDQAATPSDEASPLLLLTVVEMIPPIVGMLLVVVGTMILGMGSTVRPPALDVVAMYLNAGLAHVISGSYAIYYLSTNGLPERGSPPLMISFNVFDFGGFIGQLLGRLSIDEAIHLGLYAFLASRLYHLNDRQSRTVALGLVGGWVLSNLIWALVVNPAVR